jgi:ABC-type amino acid transport substrate-binding protein
MQKIKNFNSLIVLFLIIWQISINGEEVSAVPNNIQSETLISLKSKPLVFSALDNSLFNIMVGKILTEAYAAIGYDAEISYLPGRRSLAMGNSGLLSGEAGRTIKYQAIYPNMVMVKPSYVSIDWHLFVIDEFLATANEVDLGTLKLGVLRGVLYTTKLTENMNPIFTNSVDQLFNLLLSRRVDAIIFSGFTGDILLAAKYKNSGAIKRKTPLFSEKIYHYLEPGYAILAPLIGESLQQMVESGRVKEIIEEHQMAGGLR